MTLPILVSSPHAGLQIPDELVEFNALTAEEIAADGDEGAAEIYDYADDVQHYVTTPIARAFVDINRAPDDVRKDGVVKSHTCWEVPVWRERPSDELFKRVLDRYHAPYHARLRELAGSTVVAVDCHTMAEFGPPVGPDPGCERPLACIGIGEGTCPRPWAEAFARHLGAELGGTVTINEPFRGGYVIRHHSEAMPWLMLELSRSNAVSLANKRSAVLNALEAWLGDPNGPR